jgi:hypothetical protein
MRTLLLVALSLSVASNADGQDWSRFRGPNGSGIAGDTGFPTEFGPDRNMIWRTAVRPGKSSPVLSRRHIFLTAFDGGALYTQCFDRATGRLVWERAEQPVRHEDAHVLNEPSAATPVTDGDNVYVFFRDLGVISYDPAGAVRWKRLMGPFTNRMGAVTSPIIAGSSLLLVLDQTDRSSIVALSTSTGDVQWEMPRNETDAWATPLVYEGPTRTEIVTQLGNLPFAADWRWQLDRTDSAWYPSLRLFRQPRCGDWSAVIDGVATALQEFSTGRG